MSEPLSALEKDRSEVLRQISHLGDLRPGSIVEVMGRCSKPNCHCAQAETLSSPAALRKAQREVAEFRKFQQLSAQLVKVNEALCQQRPMEEEGTLSAAEKKQQMRSIMKSRKK